MKSQDKSPILDQPDRKADLVGGYDGERSPLQPPLKESVYDDNGRLRHESVEKPDGSESRKNYYENVQVKYESVKDSTAWVRKIYSENGQREFESVEKPDGGWVKKIYDENGRAESEQIKNPDGSWVVKAYDENGRLLGQAA